MSDDEVKYDGFMTSPDEEPGSTRFTFFGLDENVSQEDFVPGVPLLSTSVGDMFHIILFKGDSFKYDDSFEAILGNPVYYAKSLAPNFYGMFVRKSEKSIEWYRDFHERMLLNLLENFKNDELEKQ